MDKSATLVRKKPSDPQAERLLVEALRGRPNRALTRADAVALTGLATSETDAALRTLMKSYKSHLDVTDQGELLYKFDPSMARRDSMTLAERLRQMGALLWKGFTLLFKVWIVFTLVFYVAAFVAMLIAMMFARSSTDERDDRRGGGFDFPWILFWLMPDWAPAGRYSGGQGYGQQRRLSSARSDEPKPKRFYQYAFDFVFGPSLPRDAMAAEKEVVAFLRAKDGRITATDLVALTGWSYDRADEEATRLLVDYDGEPEVTEEGTLLYVFPELRKTASLSEPLQSRPASLRSAAWRYTWDQPRAAEPLTGNSDGANAALGLMNGFNLFAALFVGPAFLARFGIADAFAHFAVTAFPLGFSSLFFGIPGARALLRSRKMRRLQVEGVRAQLIEGIVERKGAAVLPEELSASAARLARGDAALAGKLLETLLVELDGDVQTDESGRTLYAFPRVAEELAAADSARKLAPATEREVGQVVFSSDDDEPAERDLPPPTGPRLLPGRTLN